MNVSRLKRYDKEIIERYLSGESSEQIGLSFDTHDSSIDYRLKINSIKKRSISQALANKPKSEVHKKKLSENRIKSGIADGERNPNWKGGIQDKWSELKNSINYQLWRNKIFERDKYICQLCRYEKGGILEAHHIYPRSKYPYLILEIDNGITLCKYCHWKIHSKRANLKLGELLENPTVKSGIISSRAPIYLEKVQRLCTQLEREDIV